MSRNANGRASKLNGKGSDVNGAAIVYERAALACVLQQPSLRASTDLPSECFLLSDHQRIWEVTGSLGTEFDLPTLISALAGKVDDGYIALEEFVRSDRLLVRTLSCPEQVSLDDPRILQAARGAEFSSIQQ